MVSLTRLNFECDNMIAHEQCVAGCSKRMIQAHKYFYVTVIIIHY